MLKVKYNLSRNDFQTGYDMLHTVLQSCIKSDLPILAAQIRLYLAKIFIQTENYTKAVDHILIVLQRAKQYHLEALNVEAYITLADIQLNQGSMQKAKETLEKISPVALAETKLETKADLAMLQAKLSLNEEDKKKAIQYLQMAKSQLNELEDIEQLKSTVHLMALLYNDLNDLENRNKQAQYYKMLCKQQPPSTINLLS